MKVYVVDDSKRGNLNNVAVAELATFNTKAQIIVGRIDIASNFVCLCR